MSKIKSIVQGYSSSEIMDFLKEEGFWEDSWHSKKCMQYVASGIYTVWVNVYSDEIYIYVEYDCGGEVAEYELPYPQDDFEEFSRIYEEDVLRIVKSWVHR